MKDLNRRNFIKFSSLGALSTSVYEKPSKINADAIIDFTSDGLNLSPLEYSQLLTKISESNKIQADYYSQGSCVEELENKFAKLLGKESAIFMPTGTLANHLAIRTLAGLNHRVILQHESHVYNDTGDCVQTLSNLNLIPLAAEKATFTVEEVQEVLKRTASGRVAAKVGVISIESPVRRKAGEMFEFEQMKKISQLARSNDIKMHLDGARIFLASAYSGVSVAEYASLFDTVYVSLYKYFNAASGAILAGDKDLIAPLFHARRMFGSGLHQAWPFAAVALHYLEGFEERYKQAVKISEELISKLKENKRFEVLRISNGTNIFRLVLKDFPAKTYVENLKRNGVIARTFNDNTLNLLVNESLLKTNAKDIENRFLNSF